MEVENNVDINKLINITQDFMNFIDKLYNEGTINHEQYKNMTKIKKQFLEKTKL